MRSKGNALRKSTMNHEHKYCAAIFENLVSNQFLEPGCGYALKKFPATSAPKRIVITKVSPATWPVCSGRKAIIQGVRKAVTSEAAAIIVSHMAKSGLCLGTTTQLCGKL